MMQPGIEPRSPEPLANALLIRPIKTGKKMRKKWEKRKREQNDLKNKDDEEKSGKK